MIITVGYTQDTAKGVTGVTEEITGVCVCVCVEVGKKWPLYEKKCHYSRMQDNFDTVSIKRRLFLRNEKTGCDLNILTEFSPNFRQLPLIFLTVSDTAVEKVPV